jgi:hypothetical protein
MLEVHRMAAMKSWLCGWPRGCFRKLTLVTVGLACAAAMCVASCAQPTFEQLIPGVTLKKIQDILADDTITDKEQALKDLGITDEQLLHILLNATLPTITTPTTG